MNDEVATLGRRVLDDQRLRRPDLLRLAALAERHAGDVQYWAHRVRTARFGRAVRLCAIVPGKLGACSEDCKWCAQSAHYQTECKPAKAELADVTAAAEQAGRWGASSLGIVNSGPGPTEEELQAVLDSVRAVREAGTVTCCASLGELTGRQRKAKQKELRGLLAKIDMKLVNKCEADIRKWLDGQIAVIPPAYTGRDVNKLRSGAVAFFRASCILSARTAFSSSVSRGSLKATDTSAYTSVSSCIRLCSCSRSLSEYFRSSSIWSCTSAYFSFPSVRFPTMETRAAPRAPTNAETDPPPGSGDLEASLSRNTIIGFSVYIL